MKDVIAIIGLGYVGLPLAVAFAEKYDVIGFDIDEMRLYRLREGVDQTAEISTIELDRVKNKILYTSNEEDLSHANIFIVTVPTPITKDNLPDLNPLKSASTIIGRHLRYDSLVIYESTVYPGVTEDECVPILVKVSGLKYNHDFFAGYSPERINPGDKEHTVTKIKKVVSGSTPEAALRIEAIYKSIIIAGTYIAPSIKVAEAAKVIENTQRDVNIALMNELSKIFHNLNIDTTEVLEAAQTKWNFLPFRPGLVGGHCIGVDPYYLAQKAIETGYQPDVIMSARKINDSMGTYVADEVQKLIDEKAISRASILVQGFTFKENCPDIRNTRVIDIVNQLEAKGHVVNVVDPIVDYKEISKVYNISCVDFFTQTMEAYDVIILAVPHKQFLYANYSDERLKDKIIYDVKSILNKEQSHGRL